MKKGKWTVVLILILAVLTLVGCSRTGNNGHSEKGASESDPSITEGDSSITEGEPSREIDYQEGVYSKYYGEMWDSAEAEGSENKVPDKETAIAIACEEFERLRTRNENGYVLTGVFFDTEDEVWVVDFGLEVPIPGACFSIAISKQNGKILNAWPGE